MHRHVQARTGIGGAGSARDEEDPGASGQLRIRVRHHRGAALLPADHVLDVVIVKTVQRGEKAFSRHREDPVHPVQRQPVGQDFSAMSCGHVRLPPYLRGNGFDRRQGTCPAVDFWGICGSLRAGSFNRKLMLEAKRLFDPAEFVDANLRLPL